MKHDASQWIPLFPMEEIPFIIVSVIHSGRKLKKLHEKELENDLSDRLRDELDRDPELRSRPVEIFREVPIYDRKKARQKQLGRTDLMFLFSTGTQKPWPYFTIETKRLHVTYPSGWKSLVSEYVTGHQGMMCFITQRYSRGLYNGAMLGYVFDGEIEKARGAIKTAIEENNLQLKHKAKPGFGPSTIQYDGAVISESVHELTHGDFTIYHLFLAV